MADLGVGALIGNYRLESVIGRGGMGIVYRAQHVRMASRQAALKVLAPELAADPGFRERFIRESDLAASLDHPNVIPVYDAGEDGGQLYIAMRLVRGSDLKALLEAEGRLAPDRTLEIVDRVAAALDFAHGRGLVHRDVKPGNIMIESATGAPGQVFLSDFGLVKRIDGGTKLTLSGHFVGTLDYAAPEVFRGEELDGRADVYSLGCVIFECLTGEVPYPGSTEAAVMYGHLDREPPAPSAADPGLPSDLDAVVERAMAKSRDDRFQTCREFVEAMRAAAGPAAAPPPVLAPGSAAAEAGAAAPPVIDPSIRPTQPTAPAGPPGIRPETIAAGPPPQPRPGPTVVSPGPLAPAGRGVVPTRGTLQAPEPPSRLDPPPARSSKRAGRRGLLIKLVGAGLAVLLAAGLLVRALGNDGSSDRVVATVNSCPGANVGTFAAGHVWVLCATTVELLSAQTNLGSGSTLVGELPLGAAFGDDSVWVTNAHSNTVSRVALGGGLMATVDVGPNPLGIAFGADAVWVANAQDRSVTRIDTTTVRAAATIDVGDTPWGVAFGDGSVWVTNNDDGTLSRIDPATNDVSETIETAPQPRGVVFGAGAVWVAHEQGVSRIDAATNVVTDTIDLGDDADALAFGGGFLWVNVGTDAVARIDPATNEVVATTHVPLPDDSTGTHTEGIAYGAGAAWVGGDSNGPVFRVEI